ncbi:unnamed protein product [Schistosoma turkestanicum]|nr:unnamed protein product [Schistosoma turkestanicum]
MAESLNIDFVPPKLYVPCTERISAYSKNQVSCLGKLRRTWSYRNKDILICHMTYIRFRNQLRKFLFFKSFSSVRRSLAQLCDGPILNGISNFCTMSLKCKNEHCVSGHTLDHTLVCLIQLYKKTEILLTRLNSCWRSCEAQFTTGHFTKVLLLIMSVLASLRVHSLNSLDEVNCCYGNLFAVRSSLTDIKTWLPSDVTLPSSLNHQKESPVTNKENSEILDSDEVQAKDILKLSTAKEAPNNSDFHKASIFNKPAAKNNKKIKRLNADTQRSLAAILPRATPNKQDDLLSVLLSHK